jgi:hypothetical protein
VLRNHSGPTLQASQIAGVLLGGLALCAGLYIQAEAPVILGLVASYATVMVLFTGLVVVMLAVGSLLRPSPTE